MDSIFSTWITWTSAVDATLARCLTGFRERAGVMAVVGEPGVGKSIAAKILARGLQDAGHTAGLIAVSPSFSSLDLLTMMAAEWRLGTASHSRVLLLRDLQRAMADESSSHGRRIVIFDDCEKLAEHHADFFGDLKYLRGSGHRGAAPSGMIFCFGRPEFLGSYSREFPVYRQLDAPVTMGRLPRAEVETFIAEVCRRSHLRPNAFSPAAIDWLADRADGLIGNLALALDRIVLADEFTHRETPITPADLQAHGA